MSVAAILWRWGKCGEKLATFAFRLAHFAKRKMKHKGKPENEKNWKISDISADKREVFWGWLITED